MINAFKLSVVMMNVIMLSLVAPLSMHPLLTHKAQARLKMRVSTETYFAEVSMTKQKKALQR
jgi:hypothetical protein